MTAKLKLIMHIVYYSITKGSSPVMGSVSYHHILPPLPPPGYNPSNNTTGMQSRWKVNSFLCEWGAMLRARWINIGMLVNYLGLHVIPQTWHSCFMIYLDSPLYAQSIIISKANKSTKLLSYTSRNKQWKLINNSDKPISCLSIKPPWFSISMYPSTLKLETINSHDLCRDTYLTDFSSRNRKCFQLQKVMPWLDQLLFSHLLLLKGTTGRDYVNWRLWSYTSNNFEFPDAL